ncbi:MAG: sigma-70 family RNA polymerase sigma factor [Phycisphaerales bacterium]|nr:MAG: sigma-70 family RNA polymerase sigma factor [Phycisphaerales bacterium]
MPQEEQSIPLVDLAVAGDQAALAELLVLHHDRVHAVVERGLPRELRGAVSAEDVCQEAYITVFQKIGDFEPRGDGGFGQWVTTIARRKLHDHIKGLRAQKRGGEGRPDGGSGQLRSARSAVEGGGHRREERRAVIGLLEMLAVHEGTPSRSAAVAEAVSAVEEALAELGGDYAAALRLHYVEHLPISAVAERLGRSEGAARMLCHRGLRRMREALGSPWKFFSRK